MYYVHIIQPPAITFVSSRKNSAVTFAHSQNLCFGLLVFSNNRILIAEGIKDY